MGSPITDETLWCGMVMVVDASCMWGQEVHGKSLYLPFNFAVNLKWLLKKKISVLKKWREGKDGGKGRMSKPSGRIPLGLKT